MTVKEMRRQLGDTQASFAERYHIPFRTIQNWESGVNTPPSYVETMLSERVRADLINRRQYRLPTWQNAGRLLPPSGEFRMVQDWLLAVQSRLKEDVVFALDSALMCAGEFLGRMNEWMVWIYGSGRLMKYRGVCVIGDYVSPCDVEEKNGLKYTCFNRTLNDALANEHILDMQGITEAMSRYYYSHNESFEGIHPDPAYIELFDRLCEDAAGYYDD